MRNVLRLALVGVFAATIALVPGGPAQAAAGGLSIAIRFNAGVVSCDAHALPFIDPDAGSVQSQPFIPTETGIEACYVVGGAAAPPLTYTGAAAATAINSGTGSRQACGRAIATYVNPDLLVRILDTGLKCISF